MNRIDAIYARQSVEKKDSISIESQIELCRRMADPDADVYQDSGYSGKDTQRPAFSRLMDDVRAGKIKRVFCYRLDRISRSVLDFSLLWKEFDANDVEFTSITESFDTNTPMGRAMVIIIMAFAQLERETIVSRYTINRYARSNSGIWAGGKAPFGFQIEKKFINGKKQSVLAPIPAKLEIVSSMFSDYANGTCSLHSLAKDLNLRGIAPEGRADHWNAVTVRRILRNPVYVCADVDIYSYYYANATIVNDVHEFDGSHAAYLTVKGGKSSGGVKTLSLAYHEGMIPSDIFISVQKSLSQNKQIKNGVRSQFTWLAGLLKCAECDGRVNTFQNKGKTYFQCYRRFHSVGSCSAVIHGNADGYESYVAKQIQNRIDNLSDGGPSVPESNAHVNALKIQLLENERQTANLIEAIKIGGASTMRAIQSELQKLESEHEKITSEISESQPSHCIPTGLTLVQFTNLDYDGKRDVARTLIDRVIVGGEQPGIIWK
ncbi:MAG: recombinase family protein [Eubacteriales bacterium]|nr:recombinase family protein [Eubacteriales bacterium]